MALSDKKERADIDPASITEPHRTIYVINSKTDEIIKHDHPCCVCRVSGSQYDPVGDIMLPCVDCQNDGYRLASKFVLASAVANTALRVSAGRVKMAYSLSGILFLCLYWFVLK